MTANASITQHSSITRRQDTPPREAGTALTARQLKRMRAGYGFVGVGLVLAKWPSLADAHTAEPMAAVTVTMLTAMSLLMMLGLRYPLQMLPILLFEALWKLLWFAAVWVPRSLDGSVGTTTRELAVKNALVVVVLALIPWRYVWNQYVRAPGTPWLTR
jgi:hypothetical protein